MNDYFDVGMNVCIGVDVDSGLVHTVRGTSGYVSDICEDNTLLHGHESIAFGDAGWQGIEKRQDAKSNVNWSIAMGPGKGKVLNKKHAGGTLITGLKNKDQHSGQSGAPALNEQASVRTHLSLILMSYPVSAIAVLLVPHHRLM